MTGMDRLQRLGFPAPDLGELRTDSGAKATTAAAAGGDGFVPPHLLNPYESDEGEWPTALPDSYTCC